MDLLIELLSLFGFLAIGAAWIFFRLWRKEKRLKSVAARSDSSFKQFFQNADPSAKENIAESVYHHLQWQLAWACIDFPVAQDDEFKRDYDMDKDDVKFLLQVVIDECPELDPSTPIPKSKALTVSEFVAHLSRNTTDVDTAA